MDSPVTYTNNRCDYCGAFKTMRHSPDCTYSKPDATVKPGSLGMIIMLTPETEQYGHEIMRFVEAMIYKLTVHSKKGKWENYDVQEALSKLRGEVKELDEAIARGNMVEQMLEAADVGNYALIISAKAMEK